MPELKLKPCPFCGGIPRFDLGRREHCQLHGDVSQAVRLYCYHDCPARPAVIAGDVYNGGLDKAKAEAAALWNKRFVPPKMPKATPPPSACALAYTIDDLELNIMCTNRLKAAGFTTLEELAALSQDDMKRIGLRHKDIKEVLEARGDV